MLKPGEKIHLHQPFPDAAMQIRNEQGTTLANFYDFDFARQCVALPELVEAHRKNRDMNPCTCCGAGECPRCTSADALRKVGE